MRKYMYELSLKEFKKNYDYGDLSMLEYLKDFIPPDLENLYEDVCNYNEIFANGWTINKLFEMGKEDDYWYKRAINFIKKYKVGKSEYDNYSDFFDKYIELRDQLIDEMEIFTSTLDKDVNEIPEKGNVRSYIFYSITELDDIGSFKVAEVRNFCHNVALHYNHGIAQIIYGKKVLPDFWEYSCQNAYWFDFSMTNEEILEKLNKEFLETYGKEEYYAGGGANEVYDMS